MLEGAVNQSGGRPASRRFRLTPLEVAVGLPLGGDPEAPGLPECPPGRTPRAALESAVLEALARPPCLVSFSGGRDSSALLAVALEVARREGLPEPIAYTVRFPGVPEADEGRWQEQVAAHLGVGEWVRRVVHDELDMLGPHATRALRRHGLFWPFNAFFNALAFQEAPGGSVLSGAFGDEILTQVPRLVRLRTMLTAGDVPRPRDLARMALLALPRPARRAFVSRRYLDDRTVPGWLTATAAASLRRALADDMARVPLSFAREVEWWWRRRYPQLATHWLAVLAGDHGVRLVTPFLDPGFLAAFARSGGFRGFESRRQLMHLLFGEALPPEVLDRSSKAVFGPVFWNRHTAEFLAEWSGEGLDPDLVDAERLQRMWRERPDDPAGRDFRSASLLQSVWLAAPGSGAPG